MCAAEGADFLQLMAERALGIDAICRVGRDRFQRFSGRAVNDDFLQLMAAYLPLMAAHPSRVIPRPSPGSGSGGRKLHSLPVKTTNNRPLTIPL
jgi:hypothetical protein